MGVGAAIGGIAGGLLGAAGPIAGGLLSKPGQPTSTAGVVPGRDQSIGYGTNDALLQLGIYDPTVLLQAGPLNQALAAYASSPQTSKNQRQEAKALILLFEQYASALSRGEVPDSQLTNLQGFEKSRLLNDSATGIQYRTYTNPATQEVIRLNVGVDLEGRFGQKLGTEKDKATGAVYDVYQDPASGNRIRVSRLRDAVAADGQKYKIFTDPITGVETKIYGGGRPDEAKVNDLAKRVGRISSQLGINVQELFDREVAFRDQVSEKSVGRQNLADLTAQSREYTMRQIAQLGLDLPSATATDLASLKATEKDRLLRELGVATEDQRNLLLRQANYGNFNPGRAVGELEKQSLMSSQNADTDALGRAFALISSQQGITSNQLGILRGLIDPQAEQNRAFGALRVGAASPGQIGASQANTAVGQGISAGAGNLGNAFALAGAALGQRGRPSTPAYQSPTEFNLQYGDYYNQ